MRVRLSLSLVPARTLKESAILLDPDAAAATDLVDFGKKKELGGGDFSGVKW